MSQALNYEGFIRLAFGYDPEHHFFIMVGRWGDLASLANTDIFSSRNVNKVKSATAYSMYIYINEIYNHSLLIQDDYDAESDRIDAIIDKVLKANDVMTIHGLIDEFRDTVLDKYMHTNGEHWVLRDHHNA